MKTTALLLLLCIFPLLLMADFQRDVPLERTQPDGTKITLYGTGDEFYGVLRDADKFTALLDPDTGYYVYAVKEGKELRPSQYKVGHDNPVALGLEPNVTDDIEVVREKVRANKDACNYTLAHENTRSAWNNLVVYVNIYYDYNTGDVLPFQQTNSYFSGLFNDNPASVRNFFLEESNNQESITSCFAPIQSVDSISCIHNIQYSSDYYQEYDWYYNPDGYIGFDQGWTRLTDFFSGVVNRLDNNSLAPAVNYDSDNDNYIDNITFVMVGEPDYPGKVLWPRSGTLSSGTLYGKMARHFNLVFETGSLGTKCHEISHSIGFPDLYREDSYTSDYHPASYWDVMDEHGDIPPHSLVYMKYRYGGWRDLPALLPINTVQSLTAISTYPLSVGRIASLDPEETYWMEFRKQAGTFESSVPGSGLIVYRINSDADGEGNYDGPPDEVYVYRPNGNLTNNGSPNQAFFSSESGRTQFDSQTNPTPFLSNDSYGGLVLADIGSSAGTSIQFTASMTNIWTGTVSTDWANAANWYFGVPDQDMGCEIRAGSPRYPVINAAANCKTLTIKSGASLTLQSSLTVHGNLYSAGVININGVNALNVYGSAYWISGSTVTMASDDCYIEVRGNMTFFDGNNIHATSGRWSFTNSTSTPNSILYVYGDAEISVLECYKTNPNYLDVQGDADKVLTINNGIYVYGSRYFRSSFPGIIDVKGTVLIVSGGLFKCNDGTVKFSDSIERIIGVDYTAGNYFYNLDVSKMFSTLYFSTATLIKNNLTISNGVLNPNNNTLYVEGDWTNTIGVNAFVEGTGQVVFSGSNPSTCSSERFNTLVLNKSGMEELIIPTGSSVRATSYDWTDGVLRVNGGDLQIDDLVDNGIYGYYQIDSGEATLIQDGAGLIDLNGFLTVNGGTLNIDGGSAESRWAFAHAAGLTMTGGVIEFKYKNISIPASAYSLTFNCTGGTVRTQGNLSVTRSDIHIYNMTFEMYGSSDATINVVSTSSIGNLTINKTSTREINSSLVSVRSSLSEEGAHQPLRTNTVTLISNVTVGYLLNIAAGTLNINGYALTAFGGVEVSGNLQMASGSITTYLSDFVWNSGSTTNITGGAIVCGGDWTFNPGSSAHLEAITVTISVGHDSMEITSSSDDSWFGYLVLNEYYEEEVFFNLSNSSTMPLNILGTLTLGSPGGSSYVTFNLNSQTVKVNNNISVYDGSKLKLGPDAVITGPASQSLTFYSGAYLEAIGIQDHPAKITRSSGFYTLNLESGSTVRAQYTIFENMGLNGINVKNGAFVDETYSFNYCTFQNGVFSGALLTINNDQVFTVYGAVFPTNTWNGNSNVKKTVNQGTVTFSNASGGFAGGSYDNDIYNRILWTTTNCELSVLSYTADFTSLYVCDPVIISATIINNSSNPTVVPVRVDIYYNRTSLPADSEPGDDFGYFDPIEASSSATFNFPATSTETVGLWQTWFRVDRLDEITETNETNNGNGFLSITWNNLPPVPIQTIIYDSFTESFILTWTYPLTVDGYNIYRSDNPMGPFTNQIGTSTDTFYFDPEAGDYNFYQVRAFKTWP